MSFKVTYNGKTETFDKKVKVIDLLTDEQRKERKIISSRVNNLIRELTYETGLIPCMALYYFLIIWGSIYSTVLNGMGKVNMQLILGCIAAVINIPLSIFLGKTCGMRTTGVCLGTVICMLISNIPITMSTHRLLNELERNDL